MTLTFAGLTPFTRPVAILRASTTIEGTVTVIAIQGEADVATLPILIDAVARAIAEHDGAVVIDLAQTLYIDTATVRALARARAFLSGRGRELTFRSPSRLPARMLAYFGLSEFVEPGGLAQS